MGAFYILVIALNKKHLSRIWTWNFSMSHKQDILLLSFYMVDYSFCASSYILEESGWPVVLPHLPIPPTPPKLKKRKEKKKKGGKKRENNEEKEEKMDLKAS